VYAQFLKAGMFRMYNDALFECSDATLNDFIESFKKINKFDFFEYSRFLEIYKKIAPNNKFSILSIEPQDSKEGDIIRSLCKKLSLPNAYREKITNKNS